MSIVRKADVVLKQAKRLASEVNTWADFSAMLFDGFSGIVPKTFPNDMERQAFFDSPQYEQINGLLLGLMKSRGVINGSHRTEKSGKFVVRVPKSVHQSLEAEADAEGVSLNQLAATKLAIPLSTREGKTHAKQLVARAFNSIHDGYSADWVVIEPFHNELFLKKCHQLGLKLDGYDLNHLLMNVRKDPKCKGMLNPSTKRSGFSDYDDCLFAAEMAIRTLQRTRGVTLDQTLCDPELLRQFDGLATKYAKGQTELKLRCAALNLRKTHRLQPVEFDSEEYQLVTVGPVKSLTESKLIDQPSGYVFFDHTRPIFAGETENLRRRIGIHMRSGLPEWLEVNRDESFLLKTLATPINHKPDRLNWLGTFINRERPVLNYQKVA